MEKKKKISKTPTDDLLLEDARMASIDTVFNCVIPYIHNGDDRNSVSLVCRKWNEIDSLTRKHVTVHVFYAPTPSRLTKRFPFLESLTLKGINYSDKSIYATHWIREIAIKFTRLKSLHVRQLIIRDSDLELLAKKRGNDLLSLKISQCKWFSENGLMCVAKYCSELRELCLERINQLVEGDKEVEEHGKWLRVLALRKTGIEKFSLRCNASTTLFDQQDVVFLLERCRESLVSLRVDYLIHKAPQAITNAGNLQDFFGATFHGDEEYSGLKLPSSIHSLGLCDMSRCWIRFVDHLLNQLRELDFSWKNFRREDCQCLFLRSCPNLEVLYTNDACGDTGLELISQVCKKLLKLTAYSGTHVGLMAVALGCPNLEYLHVELSNISNEALECVGSNLKNLRVFNIRVPQREYNINTVLPLDNGIRAMLISCTKLERLSLTLNPKRLSNVGLGFIGMYGVNLKSLSLDSIGGSNKGLMELSKGCPKLRKLVLTYCPFTNKAVKKIWLNIQSLRYIWFENADYVGLALTRPNFESACSYVHN